MAEEEDGGLVGPDEDGADEDFKVVHHVYIPVGWLVSMIKGEGEKEEGLKANFKWEKMRTKWKDKGGRSLGRPHESPNIQ